MAFLKFAIFALGGGGLGYCVLQLISLRVNNKAQSVPEATQSKNRKDNIFKVLKRRFQDSMSKENIKKHSQVYDIQDNLSSIGK